VRERDRLASVLRQLRELGVTEVFLDDLTAEEATRLATADRQDPAPQPASRDSDGSTSRLEVLSSEASGCVKCRLSEGRTQVVFGRGSADAELVVVGEAPGREEDRTGLPFVGPAGKLLDLLLLSVGIERGSAYICNVLKCRPPNNRDPMADEVATCAPYLHAQLDAIQPRVLLGVGKFAAQWLSGREQSIGRLRGSVHEYRGIPVVATYHPAYLLRSPHATRKTWQDLQLMRQVLDEHA
jgi:uracil-DNA glycosylase family 4